MHVNHITSLDSKIKHHTGTNQSLLVLTVIHFPTCSNLF